MGKIMFNGVDYSAPTTGAAGGVGTSTTPGLTKLYTSTGSNTDGTMTQSAITTALNYRVLSDGEAIGLMKDSDDKYYLETKNYGEKQLVTADDITTVATTGSYTDLKNKPTIPAAVAVKGNAESSYRTGNVNITPANIGLGNVNNTADSAKSVKYATSSGTADTLNADMADLENIKTTFTQATTRSNINSEETCGTIFGKIKKWFADLKSVAFSGSASDLTTGTLPSGRLPSATSSALGGVKTTDSSAVTDSTGLALAATEKNASISGTLANQISTINNNLTAIGTRKLLYQENICIAQLGSCDVSLSDKFNNYRSIILIMHFSGTVTYNELNSSIVEGFLTNNKSIRIPIFINDSKKGGISILFSSETTLSIGNMVSDTLNMFEIYGVN